MTTVFQHAKKIFNSDASMALTVCRTLILGAAAALMLFMVDALFPGCDALEEVGVVALLTVIELARTGMKQRSASQLKGRKQMQAVHWPLKVSQTDTSSKTPNSVPHTVEQCESSIDAENANFYYRSLQAAAKAADVSAAEAAMRRMREAGITPSIACYGTLVGVCAKTGDVARAESWLETLAGSGLGNPNVICVNMVISACAKHGQVERAAAWLQRMHSLGVEPDVMSYNAVIDACARSGEVNRAEEWLGKMQEIGRAHV